MTVGIVGNGFVGGAVRRGFQQAFFRTKTYDIDPTRRTHLSWEVANCDLVFICVPTPQQEDSSALERPGYDLTYIREAFNMLTKRDKPHQPNPGTIYVIKSTVSPGATEQIAKEFGLEDRVVYNPEFLTERFADTDFLSAPHVVLGGPENAVAKVESVYCTAYTHWQDQYLTAVTPKYTTTDWGTAELIKLGLNCFFAVKISFMNEMFGLCEDANLNFDDFVKGLERDGRVYPQHLEVPGHDKHFGFGGKCFPKDLNAMIAMLQDKILPYHTVLGAEETNRRVRPQEYLKDENYNNIDVSSGQMGYSG